MAREYTRVNVACLSAVGCVYAAFPLQNFFYPYRFPLVPVDRRCRSLGWASKKCNEIAWRPAIPWQGGIGELIAINDSRVSSNKIAGVVSRKDVACLSSRMLFTIIIILIAGMLSNRAIFSFLFWYKSIWQVVQVTYWGFTWTSIFELNIYIYIYIYIIYVMSWYIIISIWYK